MGVFSIPVKRIVVNEDYQVRLVADKAGTIIHPYAGNTDLVPATAGHKFALEGFTSFVSVTQLQLLAAATRIRRVQWADRTLQVGTLTVGANTGAKAGDIFIVRWDNPRKEPTAFQNIPLEKRYQISSTIAADTGSGNTVAAHIAATINADKNAPVTATVSNNVVTLTAKDAGVKFDVYNGSNSTLSITWLVTVPMVFFTNDYENLKTEQWLADLDFDRNAEYYPIKGAKYDSYYWEVNSTQDTGGHSVPSQVAVGVRTGFKIWVRQGLNLIAEMNHFLTDMNV